MMSLSHPRRRRETPVEHGNGGSLQLLTRKEQHFPLPLPPPTQPQHRTVPSPPSLVDRKLSELLRLSTLSLKLQVAQLAVAQAAVAADASAEDSHEQQSSDLPPLPAGDEELDCLDAEVPVLHNRLSQLTSVQDGAARRQCAFVTYVRRDVDADDAALLMFSVRSHQSVCYTLVLATDDVSTANRQRLSHFAILVDVDALPHGHDPHGYDLLRLWQLTAFEKIVFLPTTLLALRNLTSLTQLPEWTIFFGGPSNPHDVPVMTLVPSDLTFAEMRRVQGQTARTASVMQFLMDFFSREKSALERFKQHRGDQFRFTRATHNFSPISYVVRLPVGAVIHQKDFAAFVANGTDIFDNRPLAVQYSKAGESTIARAIRRDAYKNSVCGWKTHEEFRYDSNFVRYVYDTLLGRVLARLHTRKTFSFFDENAAPVKLAVTEEGTKRYGRKGSPRRVEDSSSEHAATATLRPTFRFSGSVNFTALFPSDNDLHAMAAQQRTETSELRSKFLVAMASDIETWHSIDPGLVTIADVEITPNGDLTLSCEIRLEVESTQIRPDELRQAISKSRDNRWMSRVVAVYRHATHNKDALMQYLGVQWDRPDADLQLLNS